MRQLLRASEGHGAQMASSAWLRNWLRMWPYCPRCEVQRGGQGLDHRLAAAVERKTV
ncbi:hypothetical protein [Streptomyces nigrescens]|uniref:hypothetical protein n=1 Tax=Streptomyces nigrescens TaxID=1920 RepID=UPI0036B866DD